MVASSLDVKGNKAIKKKFAFLANRLVSPNTVTNFLEICAFIIGFSFTVWTKKSAKKVRKQVTECLQNLYQSVGIHMKYVLLLLLLRLPKYLVL